jgi:hypothetical protein
VINEDKIPIKLGNSKAVSVMLTLELDEEPDDEDSISDVPIG